MNTEMTTNSQLSTTEPKKQKLELEQTTRTGTESQKWRSHVISGEVEGEE